MGNSDVGFLNDIVTGGSASLVGGNAAAADQIVQAAISQVAILNGRLGAFEENTLNTNVTSVSASNSLLNDISLNQATGTTAALLTVDAGATA